MTAGASGQTVFVEASARLHFGVLDLRGALGRWFGGVGAAAPAPTLLISAEPAARLEVSGEESDRVLDIARRVHAHYGIETGARLRVHRLFPAHAGLGSGTQLALAAARALTELNGVAAGAAELSQVVERGRRSAIGTYAFAAGGLVVEGGRRPGSDGVAPLIARLPFPPSWRCVIAVPDAERGLSGEAERAAFAELPAPPEPDVHRVAHLVLMGLLPALVDGDLEGFGAALTAIQQITGEWFAPVQGGVFAPGPSQELAQCMSEWGASGVGQSSWGPAVYGIVEGEDSGRRLAERVCDTMGGAVRIYEGPFPSHGARVWRGASRPE